MSTNSIYLSYSLNSLTPTYGNRDNFLAKKNSSIKNGDVANNTCIATTVHVGTHIDMPYHFFENGQSIKDFSADFFEFSDILYIELNPKTFIINEELTSKLNNISDKKKYTILIIKTGMGNKRESLQYGEKNYGFHPNVAAYLRKYFPNIRVFGFDSISVSSFTNRMLGREAHRAFLDPTNPILLLEDMNLQSIDAKTNMQHITIAPLRIDNCDGLPCTVIARGYF